MPSSIDMNRFEQLRASGDLPSPNGVALAVIRLIQQDEVSLAELAHVIGGDPAFVGRLIKAANGLLAHGRRPVVSVQEALMVLGLPAVRTMVLGFSLLSNYRNGACRAFDYDGFWSFSLALALAMQVLAQRTRAGAPDELFSVGLLARVGELALATLFPAEYDQVIAQARRDADGNLAHLEQQTFAITHGELTAAMLAEWGVPRVFIAVLRQREEPEPGFADGSRERQMLQSLLAADSVARICLAPEGERAALMPRLFALGEILALAREDLVTDCERIGRMWTEWGALLQLEQRMPPVFADLAQGEKPGAAPETAQAESAESAEPDAPAEGCVPRPSVPPGDRLRVLVVDDDPAIRTALRGVLEQEGHLVFEAGDGREGMERALEVQPQLLAAGWSMPGMDGLALVRALRQTRIGQPIYMLLLTHLEDDEHLVEAFEAGADDFIGKPVKPRVLTARLRAGIRLVRLQQALEREREELRHFAAELAVTNRRLQEVALTDALTGFPNRRYAIDRIQQEWAAAQRSGRPLSCMIIDVDNFKQINDVHGHDVGDDVLRGTADALRGALRAQDVICRTGGDELLAICPETDLTAALACAERLRSAVDVLKLNDGATDLRVTVSIGVAMRESTMKDVDALMKRADQGAYLAKQRGRNCVATVQRADGPGRTPPGPSRA